MTRTADAGISRLRVAGGADGAGSPGGSTRGQSSVSQVQTLQSQLGATQTDRGTLVSLPGDVTFDYDKATIKPDAQGTLDTLAALIKAQAPPTVTIEGHTDSKGDDAYNQKLSERRAIAVRNYLVSVRTVDGTKLRTSGLGELKPVAPNASPSGDDQPDGRQKNRRVEVVLAK